MEIEKYKILWSPGAYKNLDNIYNYIYSQLKEPSIAKKTVKEILTTVNKLKYFPKKHQQIFITKDTKQELRKIMVKNFIIVYSIRKNNEIWVLHIFHINQNYLNLL